MSKRQSKHYPPEFKESAVKLALDSDQPVAKTAKELGVNVSTLHTWVDKYTKLVDGSSRVRSDEHLYEELKQLKKENARLKEERDILKKAAKYFANHPG